MKIQSVLRTCVICFSVVVVCACGVPSEKWSNSELDTVQIQQTVVGDQGRFGVCWAYAATGLIESMYKQAQKIDVNLSEEAIVFYKLAHIIQTFLRDNSMSQVVSKLNRGVINEGGFVIKSSADSTADQGPDAFELIENYGLLPEYAWNFKIETEEERTKLLGAIRENILHMLLTIDGRTVSLEEVIVNVLVQPNAFPARPPLEFPWFGKVIKATEFPAELGFSTKDFALIEARNGVIDYDKMIGALKSVLASGVSIPMGFPINVKRLQGDMFSGKGLPAQTAGDLTQFTLDGGHMVLVTDFVNVNGFQGAMSPLALASEMARPASDLDYIVFKNSWGRGAKTNEAGANIGYSATGYYRMDQAYLRAATRVGLYSGWAALSFIVPKAIATKFFGESSY